MTETPLRARTKEKIRELLISGAVSPGERIKEVQLAKKLAVSRTPLREALFDLEREGLVSFEHNVGFSASELDPAMIGQLYPIVAALESLALRSLGLNAVTLVPELTRINKAMGKAKSNPAKVVAIDTEWHEALVVKCGNSKLIALLSGLRQEVRRYENVYMRKPELVAISVKQHAQVISALDAGDINAACAALETNWNFGASSLLMLTKSI